MENYLAVTIYARVIQSGVARASYLRSCSEPLLASYSAQLIAIWKKHRATVTVDTRGSPIILQSPSYPSSLLASQHTIIKTRTEFPYMQGTINCLPR